VGTGFAVTKTGGPKDDLAWRTAVGLGWRMAISIGATIGGAYMFSQGVQVNNLPPWDRALTYFGWSTNTIFAFLNTLMVGYGIHSQNGYWEKGNWKSGFRYFWDDLIHPKDPEGIAWVKILTFPFRPLVWLFNKLFK
jgi:hypothetical protein